MSVAHVREYLSQFGAEDRVIEFDVSSATVELAAQALSCEPGRIAKTLSFMVGEDPMLIVFGGKAKMMTAEELERFSGARVWIDVGKLPEKD